MDRDDLAGIRSRLAAELDAVDRQLSEHGAEDDAVEVGLDEGFADSAQATTERSEIVGVIRQFQNQRAEVIAAIERIDAGTYGTCENCGRTIGPERLEALPTVRLCLECKSAAP